MRLTRVQLDELRCIAQGRTHYERPARSWTRDILRGLGLVVWWVDPKPTEDHNESRWMLTGAGRDRYSPR